MGTNKPNIVTGVSNPYGAVFLRGNGDNTKRMECLGKTFKSCDDAYKFGCPTDRYLIQIGGASQRLYCYMDSEWKKAGWTLVWRYSFTNYASFTSGDNHITAMPNWHGASAYKGNSAGSLEAAVSTRAPEHLGQDGALAFDLWKQFGSSFFIMSNINHWLQCTENGGSFVNLKAGEIKCTNVN